MRVHKYPQSCLLLEKAGGGRLLIDAGTFLFDAYDLDDLGGVDAVVYTHRHADHLDTGHVATLLDRGAELYGNADVADRIAEVAGPDRVRTVADGETVEAAGFRLRAHDLPHVEMVDGSPGPPNTGFLVDDRLFHPGDAVQPPTFAVDTLAVPIAGPSISFREAYRSVERTGAKRAIPVHYDFFVADPRLFARSCDVAEVIVLDDGESTELA